MKVTEQMQRLGGMKDAELDKRLQELRKEQFALRTRAAIGQLDKPSELMALRREVARIKTVLSQRKRAA